MRIILIAEFIPSPHDTQRRSDPNQIQALDRSLRSRAVIGELGSQNQTGGG